MVMRCCCIVLSEAKIKGRGGAEYLEEVIPSAGCKTAACYVVCNADEGETCTFKDRELIKNDPFNLIEAIIIAGWTVNAEDAYIYLRAEYAYLCGHDLSMQYNRLKNMVFGKKHFGYRLEL